MPSHIFVRLGLWDEAIQSNIASEAASRAFAKAQGLADSSSERLHAMDYLAYAYLQTGQDAKAGAGPRRAQRDPARRPAGLLGRLCGDGDPGAARAGAAAVDATRRRWRSRTMSATLAPLDNFQWGEAHIHFARAVGAARSGERTAARAEVAKLKDDRAEPQRSAGKL